MTECIIPETREVIRGYTSFDGLTFYVHEDTEEARNLAKKRCREHENTARNVPFQRLINKGVIKEANVDGGIRSFLEFYEGDDYHPWFFKPTETQDVTDLACYANTNCESFGDIKPENLEVGETYLIFASRYTDSLNGIFIYTQQTISEKFTKCYNALKKEMFDSFVEPKEEEKAKPMEDEKCTTQ